MTALEKLTLLLQGLVPLALIGLAARPHPNRTSWVLDSTLAVTYLMSIAVAGLWLALPRGLVLVYAGILIVAAPVGTRRSGGSRGRLPRSLARAGVWGRGALAVGLVGATAYGLLGRRSPSAELIDLSFPFREGTYLVAAGGSNVLVNPHLKTASGERYRPYIGQTHAVDLVGVGGWGSRRARLSPDDPSGFAIFGGRVTAPCAGQVVTAVDSHPDRLAPGERPETLPGNHVILSCGEFWIVMAHLRRGSVYVSAGDTVEAGDPLGLVGNSGRSDEPHLHIHAQTPGTGSDPLGGDPVSVTFDGRYLVRNDRVRVVPESNCGRSPQSLKHD